MVEKKDWLVHFKLTKNFTKRLRKAVNEAIKDEKEQDCTSPQLYRGLYTESTLSTRGKTSSQYKLFPEHFKHWDEDDVCLIDTKILTNLKKQVKKILLDQPGFEYEDFILHNMGGWTVVGGKYGHHKVHQHEKYHVNNRLSVVVYLKTPKPHIEYSGEFYYFMKEYYGTKYFTYKRIETVDGLVIIMPSHIWHGAEPSNGLRQTLNLEFDVEDTTNY